MSQALIVFAFSFSFKEQLPAESLFLPRHPAHKAGLHWSISLVKTAAWGSEQSLCLHECVICHVAPLIYTLVQRYHAETYISYQGDIITLETYSMITMNISCYILFMLCCWSVIYLHCRALCSLQRRSTALTHPDENETDKEKEKFLKIFSGERRRMMQNRTRERWAVQGHVPIFEFL